jgi:hypothetical protein
MRRVRKLTDRSDLAPIVEELGGTSNPRILLIEYQMFQPKMVPRHAQRYTTAETNTLFAAKRSNGNNERKYSWSEARKRDVSRGMNDNQKAGIL